MNVLMKIKGACGYSMISNVEGQVFIDIKNDITFLQFEMLGGAYRVSNIEMLKTDNPVHTEFFMEMLNSADDKNVFELGEDGNLYKRL